MRHPFLEKIRRKAEEYENKRSKKAEWENDVQDNIDAIKETYHLSREEINSIVHEVEETKEVGLYDYLVGLFFSSKGRIGRLAFVLSLVMTLVTQMSLVYISTLIDSNLLLLLAFSLFVYVLIVLSIKRFHDVGRSGWFVCLYLVPIFPYVQFLMFGFQVLFAGNRGSNRFGE